MASVRRFLASALLAAVGVVLISAARSPLAEAFGKAKVKNDVFPLPPPQQTVVLSLGYRSALADMLFAQLLVAYGLHFQERRLLEFAGSYLETINELDPKFRAPYMLADTLLTMQPVVPPLSHYVQARAIFERGMRERPFDPELHITAGQYLLYLGITALKSEQEKDEWKAEGARALAHACEVMGAQKNLPFHCIHAAGMLEKAGKRGAMVSFVRKVLAVVDDPEIREKALQYLAFAEGEEQRTQAQARFKRLEREQAEDAPFVSPDFYALLPPRFDPFTCSGSGHAEEPECATNRRDRGDRAPTDQ